MSGSSPLLSPDALYDDEPNAASPPSGPTTPSSSYPTRTLVIIKTHALAHRFDIEPRIQAAGFEVRVSITVDQALVGKEADTTLHFRL